MLGTLSGSSEGIRYIEFPPSDEGACIHIFLFRILEHFKIFTSLYRISELPNREDLMHAILESMDFNV